MMATGLDRESSQEKLNTNMDFLDSSKKMEASIAHQSNIVRIPSPTRSTSSSLDDLGSAKYKPTPSSVKEEEVSLPVPVKKSSPVKEAAPLSPLRRSTSPAKEQAASLPVPVKRELSAVKEAAALPPTRRSASPLKEHAPSSPVKKADSPVKEPIPFLQAKKEASPVKEQSPVSPLSRAVSPAKEPVPLSPMKKESSPKPSSSPTKLDVFPIKEHAPLSPVKLTATSPVKTVSPRLPSPTRELRAPSPIKQSSLVADVEMAEASGLPPSALSTEAAQAIRQKSPVKLNILQDQEQEQPPLTSAAPTDITDDFADYQDEQSSTNPGSPAVDQALVKLQLKHCHTTLKFMKRSKYAHWFLKPVDYKALNIPLYPTIITSPMDLGTIENKLTSNVYTKMEEFVDDCKLVVDNCVTFNGKDNVIAQQAVQLLGVMQKHMDKVPLNVNAKSKKRSSEKLYPHVEVSRPKREVHAPAEYNPVSSPTRKTRKHTPEMRWANSVYRDLIHKKHMAYNWPFLSPVDWRALKIPTYPSIITRPMDLSTIKKRLDNDEYEDLEEVEHDFQQIFHNCFTFNQPIDAVYECGKKLEHAFQQKWDDKPNFGTYNGGGASRKSGGRMSMNDGFSSDDSSDDEMNNQQITMLQKNLEMMKSQLDGLLESKKKKKKNRRSMASTRSAPRPFSGASGSKRKRSPGGGASRKSKKKREFISDDEEIVRMRVDAIPELSMDQKMYVSQNIESLSPDQLSRVLALIKEGMPNVAEEGSEEIELDINSMDKRTLYRLHSYIRKCKRKAIAPSSSAQPATKYSSSGSSSSGSESSGSGSD